MWVLQSMKNRRLIATDRHGRLTPIVEGIVALLASRCLCAQSSLSFTAWLPPSAHTVIVVVSNQGPAHRLGVHVQCKAWDQQPQCQGLKDRRRQYLCMLQRSSQRSLPVMQEHMHSILRPPALQVCQHSILHGQQRMADGCTSTSVPSEPALCHAQIFKLG